MHHLEMLGPKPTAKGDGKLADTKSLSFRLSLKALSYAGRLQLVKSILFSIQVSCSSLFILPKGVIKQVAQILITFLCRGSELSSIEAPR